MIIVIFLLMSVTLTLLGCRLSRWWTGVILIRCAWVMGVACVVTLILISVEGVSWMLQIARGCVLFGLVFLFASFAGSQRS